MRNVVRVVLGDAHVALDTSVVRDVVGAIDVVRIPHRRAELVGVVPWNGRAIAVLDLACIVGVASMEKRRRTLLVDAADATIAIPVDRVFEPSVVSAERAAHGTRIAHASLEVDVDGRTLALFDPTALVQSLEGAA